jgi:hypothetical protein
MPPTAVHAAKSTQHSALSTQPAQQLGAVSTGILPSQVARSKEARSQHHHRFHRLEQSVEVGGMVLKPKRPTLAKTALEWGTLKFHYARTQRWAARFATSETPVDCKGFSKVSQSMSSEVSQIIADPDFLR